MDVSVVAGAAILLFAASQFPLSVYGQTQANPIVQIPAGETHRDCVHVVPSGSVISGDTKNDTVVREPNGTVLIIPKCADSLLPSTCYYPYNPYANYNYTSIGEFQANWTVPSAPTTQNGQFFYLWNGLQPYGCPAVIQSVLQWGNNGVQGGKYYEIASWYVSSTGGGAIESSPIRVSAGTSITGEQYGSSCSSGSCDWLVFTSVPGSSTTSLSCSGSSQLCSLNEQNAYIAMEMNGASGCSYYPGSSPVSFQNSLVSTSGTGISASWSTYANNSGSCTSLSASYSNSGHTVSLGW